MRPIERRQWAVWMAASESESPLRTVAEVLAVSAIIIILLALSLRTYENLVVRVRLSEVASLVSTLKQDIMFEHAVSGSPADVAGIKPHPSWSKRSFGRFVNNASIDSEGGIEFAMHPFRANRRTQNIRVRLALESTTPLYIWRCQVDQPEGDVLPPEALPKICRD